MLQCQMVTCLNHSAKMCLFSPLLYGCMVLGEFSPHIGYSVNFTEILRRKQVGIHSKKEHNAADLIMGTCWLLYHSSHNKTEIKHEIQRIACGKITHKCLYSVTTI